MIRNLESIPIQAKAAVEAFFTRLHGVFQNRLDSIYLYGSVVTKDFQPGKSDIDSLVLVDVFAFPDARAVQPLVRQALKERIVAPLILGLEMFERSADTFPLEFIQMRENHVQIAGAENRLQRLVIPRDVLRLKIEEQIKGKLIRLREVFMEMGDRDGELLEILVEAQRQLFPVFRNLLRFLADQTPPLEKEDILRELENRTSFNVTPFRRVWEHASGRARIKTGGTVDLYGEYVDTMVSLAKLIDRMEQK